MVKKVAISIPEPIFEEMERSRARARRDRSGWIQEAVAQRLKRERDEADVAAYVRSYREHPEDEEDLAWVDAAQQVGSSYDDEWPEAPR